MTTATTFLIKTNRELKEQASRTARELGLTLTGVVNAYLKQFVRDGEFSVSIDEQVKPTKLASWIKESERMDSGRGIGIKTKSQEELFEHLGV